MKISWILVLALLFFVALFSVQNAEMVSVRFIMWEFTMSAALVIQIAALLGGFIGLMVGAFSHRKPSRRDAYVPVYENPPSSPTTPVAPAAPSPAYRENDLPDSPIVITAKSSEGSRG